MQRSDGRPSIKVLDFGISKVTTPGAAGHDMTRTAAIVGSPYYMSPEQMQSSKDVDPRTDIWSMGIILYELLAGRTPFEAEAVTELAIKVATMRAPPVRALRPEVPERLDDVIATCLEKDPARRYQTVGDLAVALKDFGSKQARASVERVVGTLRQAGITGPVLPPSGEFRAATSEVVGSAPRIAMPVTSASWGDTALAVKPRSKVVYVVATVVGLAVVAIGGTVLLLPKKPEVPAPSLAVVAATTSAAIAAATPPSSNATAAAPEPSELPSAALSPPPTSSSPGVAANRFGKAPAWPPRATAATPAPGPAPPSCDPPFTLDQDGRKHFKPECYLKKSP